MEEKRSLQAQLLFKMSELLESASCLGIYQASQDKWHVQGGGLKSSYIIPLFLNCHIK